MPKAQLHHKSSCHRSGGGQKLTLPTRAQAEKHALRVQKVFGMKYQMQVWYCPEHRGFHAGRKRSRKNTSGGGWK